MCAATAATQPYLLLMIVVLMLAAHGRQLLAAPARIVRIAAHAAVAIGASALSLWQSGSLMVRSDEGLDLGGFGVWSANLLTFVMPTEASTLLSPGLFRYAHPEQYEGYAYLGLGTLLLGLAMLIMRPRRDRSIRAERPLLRHLPFALALVFLTAMAIGPTLTAGSRIVFRYDISWWGPLTVFRTSGRMIWPLFYTVVLGALFAAVRLPYRRAVSLCALAVIVQAIDLAGMTRYVGDVRAFGYRDPLPSPFWAAVLPNYEGLVLIPPNLCTREGFVDWPPFALRAGTYGLSINTGMTARYDVRRAREYCAELARETREGLHPDRSLYVVGLDVMPNLLNAGGGGPLCTIVDGYGVCFSAESYGRWSRTFDVPRSRLPATAEFVRFYTDLDEVYRTALGRAPHEAPGATTVRVEALVRYLSWRMEGCDHADAERRTLRRLDGTEEPDLCPAVSLHHELPPADQTHAFSRRLNEALRGKPDAGTAPTAIDPEGEAVWLQAYARERARGVREQDARASVLESIRRLSR